MGTHHGTGNVQNYPNLGKLCCGLNMSEGERASEWRNDAVQDRDRTDRERARFQSEFRGWTITFLRAQAQDFEQEGWVIPTGYPDFAPNFSDDNTRQSAGC